MYNTYILYNKANDIEDLKCDVVKILHQKWEVEAAVAQGHKLETVKVKIGGSIPIQGNGIFNIFISSHW